MDVVKVVYCHNPARWLYQPKDYFKGRSPILRVLATAFHRPLERWDMKAARTADVYVANSRATADRVRSAYGIESIVVHPPVSIDPTASTERIPAVGEAGFFLSVGRGRGYKNVDLLIDAFRLLPGQRLVAVGAEFDGPPANVIVLSRVSDEQLRWLYKNSRALLSMSHEDFGLTPIEANAFGSPVLVRRAGGFLDSVIDGVTGRFIDGESAEDVARAVSSFPENWDRAIIRRHADSFAPERFIARLQEIIDHAVGEREEAAARSGAREER